MSNDSIRMSLQKRGTRYGQVACYFSQGIRESEKPIAAILHGALRNSEMLVGAWEPRLRQDFDVILVDLPGHGRSDFFEPFKVEHIGEAIGDALSGLMAERIQVLIGESLGGLVALALARQGVVKPQVLLAADPPLTTAKLWNVYSNMGDWLSENKESITSWALFQNIFGFSEEGPAFGRIYYDLLRDQEARITIVTGDVPLWPPRDSVLVPCLIDQVDRFVVKTMCAENVRIDTVKNSGHLIMLEATEEVYQMILRDCVETGVLAQ